MKQWWKKGNDYLAAYDKKLVVWISGDNVFQAGMVDELEALLTFKGAKDQPAQNSAGHENEHWAGTEAGLLNIPKFGVSSMRLTALRAQKVWERFSTGTTQSKVVVAGLEIATRGNPLTDRSAQRLHWL